MLALWSLVGIVIFSTAAIVADDHAGPILSLIALLGWLVLLPLTWPLRGERRFTDVAFLAGFVFFLTFGIRSLILLTRSQPQLPGLLTDPAVITGFLPVHRDALLLAIVCWIAFTIGYRAAAAGSLAVALPDWPADRLSPGRLGGVVVLFAVVGWVARLRFRGNYNTFEALDPSSVGAGDTLLTWLGALATASLVLALLGAAVFRRNPVFLALGAMLILMEVGFAFYSGVRTPIFIVVLALLVFLPMRFNVRRRVVLLALPVILLVFGATAVYRNPEVFSQSSKDTAAQRFATTLERSVELGPVGLTEIALWNISARYNGTDSIGQILTVGQKLGTGPERYLLAVPSALIPRFIWRDKPTTMIAVEFGRTYLGLGEEDNAHFAPTWVGDFLLSFPVWAVPLCLMVMGFAGRVVNDYGRRAQLEKSFGFVPFVLIFPIAVQSDAWVDFGLYQVTQILVITIGAAIALRVGSPMGPVAAASARPVASTG